MFLNIKINGKRLVRFLFIVMLIVILIIFSISIYKIFFKTTTSENNQNEVVNLTDTIKSDEVFEITPENYATILQTVTDDLDSYIGCKVHFTGYVYRLIDFDDTQFVLARDMLINESTSQSLVVGFLCTYEKAYDFEENSWVDVTGTIMKGDYYGDIAQIQVTNMTECPKPENRYVSIPDDTYIPTSNMF